MIFDAVKVAHLWRKIFLKSRLRASLSTGYILQIMTEKNRVLQNFEREHRIIIRLTTHETSSLSNLNTATRSKMKSFKNMEPTYLDWPEQLSTNQFVNDIRCLETGQTVTLFSLKIEWCLCCFLWVSNRQKVSEDHNK